MSTVDLTGARVLVLGGSGVLGSAISAELARRGATVVLAGRDAERLQRCAGDIGPETRSILFDLRQPHHAAHVVSTAVEMLGGLDGIVNAAGVVAFGGIEDLDDATLDELVAADLVGPLRVIRSALPHLDGGFIVNITGVVAEQPFGGMAAYSAVKAGLSAATRALAKELRRRRIHVLDARPPHTETGLVERAIAGEPPRFPQGLPPQQVALAVVAGLEEGRRELSGDSFTTTDD